MPSPTDLTTDLQTDLRFALKKERRRVRISWIDAQGAHQFDLEGRALLGSSDAVPLRIHDRAVSRVHAELELRDDGPWLRDLGSRNGTWVNQVFCTGARLADGARVTIGETTLAVTYVDAAEIPLWPHDRFASMVARSEQMREIFVRLSQYADSAAPVLIHGETGTGKELAAQAIHDHSDRADGPFVVVDCGALPETILEAELFGHTRGAFTGAVAARSGAFEAAAGGTVFLDEIGELPLSMQPKLLRVLESNTIRRLGESGQRAVDVRFVSATHRDLEAMVAAGAFREDLYFRLAVLPVSLPPLRERAADIPLLLQHFLAQRAPNVTMTSELLGEIASHAWLGNVRELRSFADRVAAIGPVAAWNLTRGAETAAKPTPSRAPSADADAPLTPGGLRTISADIPFKELREEWNDHLEREYLRAMLAKHGRDTGVIAEAAGLDRSYIRRLLTKHRM